MTSSSILQTSDANVSLTTSASTAVATLHYIYDPLCGWCYAAAPLVQAASEVAGLRVQLHGGGMLAGANRRPVTAQWRSYVMPHDRRIAQITGQVFGDDYFEGLLRDQQAMLDSAPPTTAVLAAESVGGKGQEMLRLVQAAHYAKGLRIAETSVLRALAQVLGLEAQAFDEAYQALAGAATEQHFAQSRRLLAQVGGQGFPTLVLDLPGQGAQVLDVGAWLGRAPEWRSHLQRLVDGATASGGVSTAPSTSGSGPVCGPDFCETGAAVNS